MILLEVKKCNNPFVLTVKMNVFTAQQWCIHLIKFVVSLLVLGISDTGPVFTPLAYRAEAQVSTTLYHTFKTTGWCSIDV